MTDDIEKKVYRGAIKVPYKHTGGAYVERFITEIGRIHMIMTMGLYTKNQLIGLLAKLCRL